MVNIQSMLARSVHCQGFKLELQRNAEPLHNLLHLLFCPGLPAIILDACKNFDKHQKCLIESNPKILVYNLLHLNYFLG